MIQGRAEASMLPLMTSSTGKVAGKLRLWTSHPRQDLCLNPSAGLLLNDGRFTWMISEVGSVLLLDVGSRSHGFDRPRLC